MLPRKWWPFMPLYFTHTGHSKDRSIHHWRRIDLWECQWMQERLWMWTVKSCTYLKRAIGCSSVPQYSSVKYTSIDCGCVSTLCVCPSASHTSDRFSLCAVKEKTSLPFALSLSLLFVLCNLSDSFVLKYSFMFDCLSHLTTIAWDICEYIHWSLVLSSSWKVSATSKEHQHESWGYFYF